MFRRKFLMAAIVAGIAALAGPSTSEAAFTVTGTIGGNSATISDNNTGNSTTGTASFGAGDLNAAIDRIRSTDVDPGIVGASQMDVNGILIGLRVTSTENSLQGNLSTTSLLTVFNSSGITQILTLTITNTFSAPGSAGTLVALHHDMTALTWYNGENIVNGSNPPSVISSQGMISDSGGSALTGILTAAGSLPNAQSNQVQFLRSDNSYDLTQTFTITLGAGQSVAFQGAVNVTAVPAPAGLILAATALPFVGLLRRRLRRPEATTAA